MKEKLKSSGKIIVTTDSKDYTDSLKFLAKNNPDLINTTNFACMNEGDPIYGVSKYQRKAISNNKKIYKIEIISI